jgi:predicted deacylase
MNDCEVLANDSFRITITPEDTPPINPSPWYAVRLEPKADGAIIIELSYPEYRHRYQPKISADGVNWQVLDDDQIAVIDEHSVRINLGAFDVPLYLAGQELFNFDAHKLWMNDLADRHELAKSVIGQSIEGRPIIKIESTPAEGRKYIVLVGRQHPPEVTGALALMPFAEALYGDTQLAQNFRAKFGIIMVPIINPDGVENGHWRHNLGGVDLNRDWGPFTEPETQAIKAELERFNLGDNLALFLDFHSTGRNVFYTQAEDEPITPQGFTSVWLANGRDRLTNYDFEHAERPLTDLTTSKNYVYRTYGIPSITYEVGDHTDRVAIKNAANIFAEEMMRTLLLGEAN